MLFDNKKLIIVLICLGNITISFNTGAVAAAIPNISADLGLPDFVVAKLVPFYMIPYGLGALIYAWLTKYFSYRSCALGAMLVYAGASFWSAQSRTLDEILAAQIFAGIGAASSTPLSLMIIGAFFEKNIRGRLVGIYFGCAFFASMAGMFFMGIVPWRLLFMIPAVIGFVNVLCWWFFNTAELNSKHDERVDYFEAFTKEPMRHAFIFIFIMSFLYHALYKWYGIYLHQEYGLDNRGISWVLLLAALCGLTGQQIGGYLSDKKGRLMASYAGMAGLGVGAMFLAGHYPTWVVTVILGFIQIGWTMNHNSVSTILTDFPGEDRPVIASLNSSVRFISGGIGFSLSKYFVERSFGWTFFGIGVLFLAMIFTLRWVFAKHT